MKSVRSEISGLMKSGMSQKQAIPKAISMKRRMKKMAEGGAVEMEEGDEGSVNSGADGGLSGQAVYPKGDDERGLSESVLAEELLAKGLQSRRMKANDNSVEYDAFPGKEAGQKMNQGGLLVEEHEPSDLGNKPELDWIDDGTAEPMSSIPDKDASLGHSVEESVPIISKALSAEAISAIEAKKKKRRFSV